MLAENEPKLPQIKRCYLTKMNVTAGDMPEPGTDVPIMINTSARIEDIPDEQNSKLLTIDIDISNESHSFYEMEVQAQATVLYPADAGDNGLDALNIASIQEVVSAVRIMLDSATTHFKHGAIRIPAINLAESIISEQSTRNETDPSAHRSNH